MKTLKALKKINKYYTIMVADAFKMFLQPNWNRTAMNFYFIFIIGHFLNQSINV